MGKTIRVRMLKQVVSVKDNFAEGNVYEVSDKVGKAWCHAGLAMEDKSKDGASETKAMIRSAAGN